MQDRIEIDASDAPPIRRRRPSRAQVRARLIEGAMLAFAERGFMGASIDLICAKAGFSRGAFYSNFEDKDALFFALYDRQAQFIAARIERGLARLRGCGDPLETLRAVLAEPDPDELRWDIVNKEFIVHALRDPEARRRLVAQRAALRRRIAEGLGVALTALGGTTGVDLDELARFVIALHEGDLTQRGLEPEERGHRSLESEFVPLLLQAIGRGRRDG